MISAVFVESYVVYLLALALKATVVLGIASWVAFLLRRASAAARHLVWATAIVSTLLLPLPPMLLRAWEAPFELVHVSLPPALGSRSEPLRWAESEPGTLPAGGGADAAVGRGTAISAEGSMGEHTVPDPRQGGQDVPWPWVGWLLAAWAAGASILLLRLLVGWIRVHRLRQRAEPVRDRAWRELLDSASHAVGLEQEVTLLQSPSADVPMTWGILRPVVLLPSCSVSWPTEQRRAVLLHEMAHVARRDCLVQTLAEIACALYWFHPLTWFAVRRLRVEREQACDDHVLSTGESAAAYATHLLEVARLCRSLRFGGSVAAAMARPSQLEGRLLAVLDGTRSRVVPGWRARSIGFASTAFLLLFLGATTVASAPSQDVAREAEPAAPTAPLASGGSAVSVPVVSLPDEENGPLTPPAADSSPLSDEIERSEAAAVPNSGGDSRGSPAIVPLTTSATNPDTGGVSSVAAYPGETIRIDLPTGGEVRIVGWNRESVEVHRTHGGGAVTPKVSLTRGDGEVRLTSSVEPRESPNDSHRYEIRVPTSAHVAIETRNGAITVEGVRGTVSGQTGGGEIRLERLNGELRLATGRGDVMISDSEVSGEVRTEVGNLRLRNTRGGVHVITAAGEAFFDNSGARFTAIKPDQ